MSGQGVGKPFIALLLLNVVFGFNLPYLTQTTWEPENCLWICLRKIMTADETFILNSGSDGIVGVSG